MRASLLVRTIARTLSPATAPISSVTSARARVALSASICSAIPARSRSSRPLSTDSGVYNPEPLRDAASRCRVVKRGLENGSTQPMSFQ